MRVKDAAARKTGRAASARPTIRDRARDQGAAREERDRRPEVRNSRSTGRAVSLAMHYATSRSCAASRWIRSRTRSGAAHLMTGKFPRGPRRAARRSRAWSRTGDGSAVLLAVNTESYAEGLPSYASATKVASASEMAGASGLRQADQLVERRRDRSVPSRRRHVRPTRARRRRHDRHVQADDGQVTLAREVRCVALPVPAHVPTARRPEALHLDGDRDVDRPRWSARACRRGCPSPGVGRERRVRAALEPGSTITRLGHRPRTELRTGLDALGRLIQVLKDTPHKEGGSVCKTTLLLFRTSRALLNAHGRDHHLASACSSRVESWQPRRRCERPADGGAAVDLASGKPSSKACSSGAGPPRSLTSMGSISSRSRIRANMIRRF